MNSSEEYPSWFSEIDHTGDIGIVVSALDLPELFERAAWGMFAVIVDPATVRTTHKRIIEIEADDMDALLVRWLSELYFLHATEGTLFCEFEVLSIGPRRLKAAVAGEPADATRHEIYTEIKAVTFHGLHVEKHGNRYRAQIIFDM